MPEAAHILFPNDAPKSQQPPAGIGGDAGAVAKAPEVGKAVSPAPSAGPADKAKPDPAAAIFKNDATDLGAKAVNKILGGFANSAIGDSDGGERFRAIEAARDGLLYDAKAHGTNTTELAEVMAIVHERQADSIGQPMPEVAERRLREGLEASYAEGITDADLSMARRLIADIEKVAPGTIHSLERSGAGSDIRLIRAAVKEARRRYG